MVSLSVPSSLRTLIDRFEPTAFDAPQRRAQIRLVVQDEGKWDVVVDPRGARLGDAVPGSEPHATLTADRETWSKIASNLRGGMDAYRAGHLRIRHNLHLGVSLLAATSGTRGPERLRFRRIETASGELSLLRRARVNRSSWSTDWGLRRVPFCRRSPR